MNNEITTNASAPGYDSKNFLEPKPKKKVLKNKNDKDVEGTGKNRKSPENDYLSNNKKHYNLIRDMVREIIKQNFFKENNMKSIKPYLSEYGRKKSDIEFENKKPHQQIGLSIKNAMSELSKINNQLNTAIKIKNESGVHTDNYWKNTHKLLLRLEQKMNIVKNKLKTLRT